MTESDAKSPVRCRAVVWRRDTYRYSGRGPSGFSMHHTRCRCRRRAGDGGLCRQHAAMRERGHNVPVWGDLS